MYQFLSYPMLHLISALYTHTHTLAIPGSSGASSAPSELLLCVWTAGLLEQGQASQHLSCRQFSVDFVVPRTHVDTVSHLLLLPDHCQETHTCTHNSSTWSSSHSHSHTLLVCAAEFMPENVSQRIITEWKLKVTCLCWLMTRLKEADPLERLILK